MSEKHARVLTSNSNRAKAKSINERKVVFKSAVANPYAIQWPSVPINLQNSILAYLVEALDGVSSYRTAHNSVSRRQKRSAKLTDSSKENKMKKNDCILEIQSESGIAAMTGSGDEIESHVQLATQICSPDPEPPIILRHLIYGINEVTKRLELQARSYRRPVVVTETESSLSPSLGTLFVCRADVNPALLIDHLPHLVAACNSSDPSSCVRLVPLPQGSEIVLAKSLGVRRVAVLAIDKDFPIDRLKPMLDRVPILSASWLSVIKPSRPLIMTHVKHLRTTSPKDMKAARESRNLARSLSKKKKESI